MKEIPSLSHVVHPRKCPELAFGRLYLQDDPLQKKLSPLWLLIVETYSNPVHPKPPNLFTALLRTRPLGPPKPRGNNKAENNCR